MKVSILQMPVAIGDRAANIVKLRYMMELAAKDAPDAILLPELWDIGFFPRPLTEYTDDNGAIAKETLSSLAAEYGVNIVGGSIARGMADGSVGNTMFVMDRDGGCVATYDKTHLFSPAKEEKHFAKGDHLAVFELDGVTCAAAICYDLRFPELFRALALNGASVVFIPAEWPTVRLAHWRILTQARAIENQFFLAACNGSGTFANGMPLAGRSALIDPWGERLAEAGEGEAIITAEFDMSIREKIKHTIDVMSDRRPELY